MTRKDYILIVRALRNAAVVSNWDTNRTWCIHEQLVARYGVIAAAEYIANELHDDNPRFERELFLSVVRGEKEVMSRPPR